MASLDQADTMSATPDSSSPSLLATVTSLWKEFTDAIEWLTAAWLPGLAARLVFAAVLFGYYWNAALTKIDGSIFTLSTGAYAQIIPPVIEAAGYDKSAVALPWTALVYAGTYAEFVLPILLVIGLFGRLAAFGMIGFVIVQSYVDLTFHGVDAETAGAWFDRFPDSIIFDQRLLWLFPLIYLVLKGPGLISVDALLGRVFKKA
ncbi:MAG: DoxX family protein [Hyphomicrobiales bacterium]